MKRITIDLEESQFERLRKAAFDGREPMAAIVRDALADWLAKHAPETTADTPGGKQ